MSTVELPRGFSAHVANIGIKDDTDDFVVVASDVPCAAAAVFTRSRFAGPSVEVSRRHVADGSLQAVVVVSKNANVATGPVGLANAEELADAIIDYTRGFDTFDENMDNSRTDVRPFVLGDVFHSSPAVIGAPTIDLISEPGYGPLTDPTSHLARYSQRTKVLYAGANDGMLQAEDVAQCVVEALAENRFMILPHPQVRQYLQNKAENYERWVGGMRKFRRKFAK